MSGNSENSEKWTDQQRRFIDWLALPKAEKRPKTHQLFAKEIGVHPDTLTDWKKIPGLMAASVQRSRELVKEHIADIIGALVKEAKKGSIPHIDRAFAMAGLEADVEAAGKGAGNTQFNVLLTKVYGDDDGSSPATE
jgi:hypothetical protein